MSLPRQLAMRVTGADLLAPAFRTVGRGLITIFTLHRFTDPEHGVVGHDPAALREQLAYLRRHRYRLLSLTDVIAALDAHAPRQTVPGVAFTVDDGYGDFARVGAPVFAQYDCPVTLFVPTGFLDRQLWLWWDQVTHLCQQTRTSSCTDPFLEERRYHWSTPAELVRVQDELLVRLEYVEASRRSAAITRLSHELDVELPASPPPAFGPISWDDVRRTARQGATFGPHTVTHPILTLTSDEACAWEIEESYRRLRQETDASVPVFCYPAGAAKRRELEAVRRAGLQAAVTTTPGYAAPHGIREWGALRRFALPRFPTAEDRPHLVNVVAGLARLRTKIRRPRPRG